MDKRGQVTLFVIIAMMILVIGGIIYSLTSGIQTSSINAEENPRLFLKDCIEDDFDDLIYLVSMNGGSVNPEFYYEYYGDRIEYLCSTGKSYETCAIQKPFLRSSIEKELVKGISKKLETCISSLESSIVKKGFTVESDFKGHTVLILPKRIALEIDYDLITSNVDSSSYTEFTINLNSKLYELIGIARSIVEWESLLGDVDPTEFMAVYHDIKIEKKRGVDEVKIYILEDRKTKDKFQLASRSLTFPAGLK